MLRSEQVLTVNQGRILQCKKGGVFSVSRSKSGGTSHKYAPAPEFLRPLSSSTREDIMGTFARGLGRNAQVLATSWERSSLSNSTLILQIRVTLGLDFVNSTQFTAYRSDFW